MPKLAQIKPEIILTHRFESLGKITTYRRDRWQAWLRRMNGFSTKDGEKLAGEFRCSTTEVLRFVQQRRRAELEKLEAHENEEFAVLELQEQTS